MSGISPAAAAPQKPFFGPAGRGESFKTMGFKDSTQVPEYLAHFGLNAFEYQGGHGVRLNAATGAEMARLGRESNICYSIHAPYYISMGSPEEEKREASLRYLLQSAEAVHTLGGDRVIFHCGGAGKGEARAEVLARTVDVLARARAALDAAGLEKVHLCPETMGRLAQLGTLDEVLALCKGDKRHIPCIDFGHLNAVAQGGIKTMVDFAAVTDAIGEALGDERARMFHVHFSKIEFTAAGERRHLTFEDAVYGPPFEPFMELCAERNLAPHVICESAGTQSEDAQTMKKYYEKYIKE